MHSMCGTQAVESAVAINNKTQIPTDSSSPLLLDLVSQYPILSSIAAELSIDDILNFGLASKHIWSSISSASETQKLSKSVSRNALQCCGLDIQVRPFVGPEMDDVYHIECTKKRGREIKRCQGCGVGVCETCRFRITHGTVLTLTGKRHWFFPSHTRSGPRLVNDNTECLVSSFTQHGHGPHKPLKSPCPCTYEDRWLNKWLCVPCLNKDLFNPIEKES